MGSAYTPGLTVSSDTLVRRVRRLPIKGEVHVKVGDAVGPDDVVARAMLPGLLQTIRLAEKLGVEPGEAPAMFNLKVGDPIQRGDVIATTRGFFGLGKQQIKSDVQGTVETISEITGNVLVREPSIPVDIFAYIRGKVVDVMPGEGASIETRAALVQGIFGVGGERNGTIQVVTKRPDEHLDAPMLDESHRGKIVVGGSGVTLAALERASELGVVGIVVGAVRDVDLIKFLGYDIGVAITGQEPINLTLVCTEGFGDLAMAERTFELFRSLEGKAASLNGATQIRAGVIRPEVIAPEALTNAGADAETAQMLDIGTPIRIIREPYFGRLGSVTGLPAQLQTVDSGAEVRVLRAKLSTGEEVTVPRANVEIIAAT